MARLNKPSYVFRGAVCGYLIMPELRLGRIHLTLMVLLEMCFLPDAAVKYSHTGCRAAVGASGCFCDFLQSREVKPWIPLLCNHIG